MNGPEGRSNTLQALPFLMVFGGCMSAVIAMEYILKANPKAGNLLSLSEFAFVLIQSLPSRIETKAGAICLRSLQMPKQSHFYHAALGVSMSVLANVAFSFNISVPIHTLFRSCNVIASVLLGYVLFGQHYSVKQLVCVFFITVGIFLGSVGDAKQFVGCPNCDGPGASTATVSDEGFMRRHANCGTKSELAEEFSFTSHLVSFFPFIFLWDDVMLAGRLALESAPLSSSLPIPTQFLFFLANNLCQLVCIKGVFRLSAHFSPLTVNITLSVRKFLSVVVSIIWFGNAWTNLHSIATVAIFGGVFAYSQCKPVMADMKDKDSKRD